MNLASSTMQRFGNKSSYLVDDLIPICKVNDYLVMALVRRCHWRTCLSLGIHISKESSQIIIRGLYGQLHVHAQVTEMVPYYH